MAGRIDPSRCRCSSILGVTDLDDTGRPIAVLAGRPVFSSAQWTNSSRFGEPVPAPITCGVAIDVPLKLAVAVSLVFTDDTIATPGPKMSRQRPKLENDARRSVRSVAPTVIAAGTRAGLKLQALALLLPAAIAYVTPAEMDRFTAASIDALGPPPRLMFATAGLIALRVTQLMPATTLPTLPLPLQSSTRTATSWTRLATPNSAPPTVPATCVPWPLQSSARPPSMASNPLVARPPKVRWLNRMPVSMMYACTFEAVLGNVYDRSSGRFRWSIRSSPHDGGLAWVAASEMVWFCSTTLTARSAASRRAAFSPMLTSKPCRAVSYVWRMVPP